MSDLIITPSSGKIDFIYQSGQETSRLESIIIDPIDGLVFSGKISASSVNSPLNITATSSNINYPFIFASSGTTGAKSLLMDSAGGTYNPSTNLATIDISGTSSWATNAVTNANLTGDVTSVGNATTIANSVVTNAKLANSSVTIGSTAISLGATTSTIAGLTSVTSTTFVGALTGTATTASYANALNAANSYTVVGITGNLTGTAATASYANNLNTANQYTVGGITGSHLGTSSWATNATNALQLGGTAAASYVTLTGAQTLTDKTITGTFTGALTGTATTASYANALNAANSYTVAGITGALTGTSSWATNAVTANALSSMNISQFTNNSSYQYHRGDITSLSSSATNLVQPLGTFDGQSITNAPTSGWYNYLSSTHGSYLTSLIANLHRTADWYVGYKEGPGGTPTNPTWYKLLHSGNYTDYTVTKTGTGASGNWTITSSWATNALTATNATQLNGQAASYYTDINARLGYTPVNKAGDTVTGNLIINGNFSVNGSFTAFSASNVYISSSQLYIEDNILTLNAFSPYLRYAGIEMYDSGSGTLSQLLWDGEGDYFFLTGSSVNGKIITGPDGQTNLTSGYIPKATAGYKLGNSLIYDDGTNVGIGTTSPIQKLHVVGNISTIAQASSGEETSRLQFYNIGAATYDIASIRVFVGAGQTNRGELGFYVNNGATQQLAMYIDRSQNVGIGTTVPSTKFHVFGNAEVGDSTADTGLIVRHGAGAAQYGRIRFYSTSTNIHTIHSFPTAWNGGTFLNASAGAINLQGTNGITFGSWNDIDVAFGSNSTNYFKNSVGIGTTVPVAKLQVNSTTAGATLLRTDGTNGTLFSVVDDLSDSLMSVNNSAGLPVLEVFADDRIVMGQYGQNDFVLVNNKVGIGTNNPANKLTVSGSVSIGESYINTTAPSNGLAVQGNVGIGTTSPGQKLEVATTTSNTRVRINSTEVVATEYFRSGTGVWLVGSDSSNSFKIARASNFGTNDYLSINSVTADVTFFDTALGARMTLNGTGLGIGTTLPTAKLHVQGNISGSSFTSSISNAVGFLGTSSWATNATNALQLGGTAAADYVTLTGTQTLTGKTITGTFTGNLTGTATTASYANALNAANSYTVVGITGNLTGNVTGTATTASYANALNAANSYTVVGITGNLTGNVTGTATTASYANALNAANSYTVTGITGALTGTSSWATNATNALQLGGTAAASYVTLTGTQTLTGKTITGTFTGNLTGTSSWASNAVTALNGGVTSVSGTANQVIVSGNTGAVTFSLPQSIHTTATPTFTGVSATTFTGNLTGTATTASYANALNPSNSYTVNSLTEGGYLAYPLREYVINFSALSATNFYPVAIYNPPGTDSTWHNQFSVDMTNQSGGEAYNMHSMYGEVRGQGWTDQNQFYRVFHTFYDSAERSILGIWRGTQTFYGVVVYLRGGKNYYVRTTSRSAVGYSAAQTLGSAVFAIKNAAGADVSGTSANIGEMLNLINNPSGFYQNDNAYIGTNQVVHLGTTSAPNLSIGGTATNALQLGGTVAASYVTLTDTQSLSNKTLTSPILVTPALGTPSSGNLTSCTFPTLNQNTTGTAATASYANALNAANSYTVTNLTANGNVGIGTTSPLSKLHISGSGQTIMRLDSDTTTSVSQFQIKAASDAVLIMGMFGGSAASTNFGVTAAGQAYIGTTTLGSPHPTSLVIATASPIPTIFSTNNVERMRIDGTGLVGIGTTVPSTLLHAYGSDGRYFTYSGTSGAFTIQRNAITTGGATPVLSLINTQGTDSSTGRGTSIQLDLGYGGSSSAVGTAARGARIAALGETLYDATAANQNAVLAFFTSTAGSLTEKLRIRSDGSLSPITVSSTTAGATLLRTDGTNGTLFSVVDDLGDSLMSVNNSAGLPVLEVFADDRIVAGQYGQNDFVVVNNKVGIGTNNPLAELHVTSSTSIPSAIFMGGNVGIGLTLPTAPLHVVGVISGSSFTGAGTGLTGTAAGLSIGGTAATVTTNANLTGDVTSTGNATTIASNAVTSVKIADSNVTLAKIVNISTGTILGNNGAGTAAPLALTSAQVAAMLSGQPMNIAGTASFATARNINGTSFNHSADITTATWGTARTLTIGSTGKSVNGSADVSWTLAELGAAATNQTMFIGTTSVAINRTSASQTLTGVSIDGNSAAVTNGVYTTGNQSIAGNKTFTGTTIVTGSIETASVRETFSAVSSTTTVSIDLSTATVFNLTFTSTISAFNITNVNTSRVNSFTLITAPNGTAATIAWSFQTNSGGAANVKWASNVSPTATTTTGRFDIFSFVYNGANWYGFTGGQNYV